MHIGILQAGQMAEAIRPVTGDYPDMFIRLLGGHGLTFTTWHVEGGEFPASPDEAEGWLITGSRHGAYEDHAWIAPLETLIREIVAAQRPLVGICFGHQIIAQALGGTVIKHPGGWRVGPTVYRTSTGEDLTVHAWHQDQVVALPEGAQTIASSETCEHAAFVLGDTVLTWQPHPEFGEAELAGLVEHRGSNVDPDRLANAREGIDAPTDRHDVGTRIAAFLKSARADAADVA